MQTPILITHVHVHACTHTHTPPHTPRRKFISELLNILVTEKFGNRAMEDDFSGPSDASEAPGFFSFGGSNYVISPEVDNSSPVDQSPVSAL